MTTLAIAAVLVGVTLAYLAGMGALVGRSSMAQGQPSQLGQAAQ